MNLDKLKSIIQKANPEIMEKVCPDCSRKYTLKKVQGGWRCINCKSEYADAKNSPHDKILGRPIRLADVLLAIDFDYEVRQSLGTNAFEKLGHFSTELWNLKDDNLDNQSDECKQFLIDLLTV